nr:MAG TPA: Terminase DNA packaging enzyme [Caudoviricetes sp.]
MNDLTDSVNISEFLDLKVPDDNDQNYEIETFKKIEYTDISDENEEIIKSKIIKDQELSRQYLKTSIEKMFELADCLQTDLKKFDTPNIEYVEALNNTLKNISLACTNFSKINQQSMMALQSGNNKKSNEPVKSTNGDVNNTTNNVQNNILFNGNLQDLLTAINDENKGNVKILNE